MVAERASVDPGAAWAVGVDLTDPSVLETVRRIFYARFGAWVRGFDLDPEDVLAAVLIGIRNRNAGRRPFDPGVARLSTYLYQVCRSVTINEIKKVDGHALRFGVLCTGRDLAATHQGEGAGRTQQGHPWSRALQERGGPMFWHHHAPPPGRRVDPVVGSQPGRQRRRRRRRYGLLILAAPPPGPGVLPRMLDEEVGAR